MTGLDQSDPIQIECQLSINVDGRQEKYTHTFGLTPADLSRRDAPEGFSEVHTALKGRGEYRDIRAIARFRRLR